VLILAISIGPASIAAADVLVNAIEPSTVKCGKPVEPGIWYQSFSGGERWAHMTIKTRQGKIVWRKNTTATTSWRYWRFYGKCGVRYVLTYRTVGGTARFHFRVRAH
jgi:hypothetical protein